MKYSRFFFFFHKGMNKIKIKVRFGKPNIERHKVDTSDVDKAD
jgi:hypothetical protein